MGIPNQEHTEEWLEQLLVAVECHHMAWYDATEGTSPIEPADQKLWAVAADIRHKLEAQDD